MNELNKTIEAILDSGQPKEAVAEGLLRATLEHFQSETGTMHLLDAKKNLLYLVAQLGLPATLISAVQTIPVGKGIAGQTVARKQPVTMCNLQTNPGGVAAPAARQSGIGGMMCVPLRDNGTIVGTLGVGTQRSYQFTAEEVKTLEEVGKLVGTKLKVKSFPTQPAKPASAPGEPSAMPNSVVDLVNGAGIAWRRREFQKSLDMLERAHKLDPDEPRILLSLGRSYGIRANYEAAEKYFEKAIRVTGWKTFTFVVAAEHCLFFGQHEMGRKYLERAFKQNGQSPEGCALLAEIEERQNHLDAASELFERAERLSPNYPPAQLGKARLLRLNGKKEEAEKTLRQLLGKPVPHAQIRANTWYELGKILDSQKRHDEAMAAFLAAKDVLLPSAEQEMEAEHLFHARLEKTQQTFTAEMSRQWHDAASALQPHYRFALLGGHPRSGTTLLEQVLDSHPDMVSSEETLLFQDEILTPLIRINPEDNICNNLNAATPQKLLELRANYYRLTEAHLRQPIGGRLLIDKNPSLTTLVPSISRVFPEGKFLIALRDPRDVVLSCFMQSLPINPVTAMWLTLEGTVTEYCALMGSWLDWKSKLANPWLEVRYEDLVDDLESTARKTLEFLNVPWDPKVLGFHEHAQAKVVRSPTYADVKKPVYRGAMGRWRSYQKYLEPYLDKLEPFAKAFGYE